MPWRAIRVRQPAAKVERFLRIVQLDVDGISGQATGQAGRVGRDDDRAESRHCECSLNQVEGDSLPCAADHFLRRAGLSGAGHNQHGQGVGRHDRHSSIGGLPLSMPSPQAGSHETYSLNKAAGRGVLCSGTYGYRSRRIR